MLTPFERATRPDQYDLNDLSWAKEGRAESTHTKFFWEYLEPYVETWRNKTVLDIGAGTGWLIDRALKYGATQATGIEPSGNNILQGKRDHPTINLVQSTFEEYDGLGQKFNEIVAVMSLPHMANVDQAFSKIYSLLHKDGEVIIVVPDFEYFKTARHNYSVQVEPIDDESYAVSITRTSGTLADIVRDLAVYERAATNAGLVLVEHKEMKPTATQIAKVPSYGEVKDRALTHLLLFKVKTS